MVRMVIGVALAAAALATPASSQTFSTYSGSVVDQTGAVVPGTTLQLVNRANDSKYEVRSGPTGQFEFLGLVKGDYELRVASPGFRVVSNPVTIDGRLLRRDVVLQIGSLEETITVVHQRGETAAASPVRRAAPVQAAAPPACVPTGIGGNIKQPRKIVDVRPIYPSRLGESGDQGLVLLDAVIGTDGTVDDVRPIEPVAAVEFTTAAIDAVRQWQFTPTLLNCVPVQVSMKVTARFSVR